MWFQAIYLVWCPKDVSEARYLKHLSINGCFNWMIPNHYIKIVVSPCPSTWNWLFRVPGGNTQNDPPKSNLPNPLQQERLMGQQCTAGAICVNQTVAFHVWALTVTEGHLAFLPADGKEDATNMCACAYIYIRCIYACYAKTCLLYIYINVI